MNKRRLFSALAAFCVLLGVPTMGTSCTPEDLADTIGQFVSPATQETVIDIDSREPLESDTVETLPGKDTLATDCTHRFGAWTVAVEPKCEEKGLRYRLCELCDGREEGEVDATGHTETVTPPIPSTCTIQGAEGGTHCSVCKEVLVSPTPTPVKEHTFHASGICTACGTLRDHVEGLDYLDLYNQSYGYDYLGTMENGEACQQFYRLLDEQVRAFHTDPSLDATTESEDYPPVICKLNFEDLGLSKDDAQAVWKTYRDDNPLYYWLSNMVGCGGNWLYLMADADYAVGTHRIETNGELYQSISGYLSKLPTDATDYEIALLVHDAVIDAIDYAWNEKNEPQEEAWAHSILGVFDGRGAVCEGFARAYQLLLNFKGVDCLFVTGESRGQGHAWNVIQLDGEWYGVDVTWDDGSEETDPYAYFCLSETVFHESHIKDSSAGAGIEFLYEIPTLSEYSIQWVDLYLESTLVGRYICIDRAFEAMTEVGGNYTLQLLEGRGDPLLHDVDAFYIYGDLPTVGSLTVIGSHRLIGFNSYTATCVYLKQDVALSCDVALQSLFLMSEESVTVFKNGHDLYYGSRYYSSLKNYVSLV